MTDDEVLRELRSESLLNRVRKELSSGAGKIEQACKQRRPLSAIEVRRMEFELASKVIATVVNGCR